MRGDWHSRPSVHAGGFCCFWVATSGQSAVAAAKARVIAAWDAAGAVIRRHLTPCQNRKMFRICSRMWTHRRITQDDPSRRAVLRDGVIVGTVYLGMQIKRLWWFWSTLTGENGGAATQAEALNALRQAVLDRDG